MDLRKLRDYCLSLDHESGKHQARVFAAVLGLRRQDAEWLRDRLVEAATTGQATLAGRSRFGALYVVDFWLTTPSGSVEVRSGWILRSS